MQQKDGGWSQNPKVDIMWGLLSTEQQQEIFATFAETLAKLKKSGKLEYDRMYPLELTKAFDEHEPKRWVYIKLIFRANEIENNLPVKSVNSAQILIEDIDVYKEPQNEWIDHVNRINKMVEENKDNNQTVFYENLLFDKKDKGKKKKGGSNKDDGDGDKKDSDKKTQTNINNPIDNTDKNKEAQEFFKSMPKMDGKSFDTSRFVRITEPESNNNSGYDAGKEITKEELFDFYDENGEKLNNDEYLHIFRLYTRSALNSIADGSIHYKYWKSEFCFNNTLVRVKFLQRNFSNCNFWDMDKDLLSEFGFINWADKMLLIPFWAFPVILKNSIGKKLLTRENKSYIISDDSVENVSFVNLYGCCEYGIPIKDVKNDVKLLKKK